MKYGIFLFFVFSILNLNAQISGTKSIGSDFTSLASAINALNSQGVGTGGAVINVPAGYTETAPAGGFLLGSTTLNNSLSSSNSLVIQKTPGSSGTNPLLTAQTGSSNSTDGIFIVQGADYISINSIDIQESSANSPFKKDMEWGYAFVKLNANDGCQNISVNNCHITLDINYIGSCGIFIGNNTSSSTSILTINNVTGTNSNISINGCVISGCYQPIVVSGYTGSSSFYDTGLQIGVISGNLINNFGGSSSNINGINISGQHNPDIENNTISFSASSPLQISAINIASSCDGIVSVNNNSITATATTNNSGLYVININAAASEVNIKNNNISNCTYKTASNGSFYGIYQQGEPSGASVNIINNTISGTSFVSTSSTGTGNLYSVYKSNGSADVVNINNNNINNNTVTEDYTSNLAAIMITSGNTITTNFNVISNNSISGSGATTNFYGINVSGISLSTFGNQVYNNIVNISGHSGSIYGIYANSATSSETYQNNFIYSLSTAGKGTVYGIYVVANSTNRTIRSNLIYTLSSNGGVIYGIYQKNSQVELSKNKIYDLNSSGITGIVNGIYINGGTNITIVNNLIGVLNASSSNSTNALNGIAILGGSSINIYFNTVYLNAITTSISFGSSALFIGNTSPSVTILNNIFYNSSSTGSTNGFTAALRYVNAPGNTYMSNSGNNIFYAGNSGPSNLLYGESTGNVAINGQSTISSLKTYLSPREQFSATEQVQFSSILGSDATFLHINTTKQTWAESGGVNIAGYTDDYDGDTRNTSKPDIGADEFNGIMYNLPITLNYFSGINDKNINTISWRTEIEEHISGFELQISENGNEFKKVAFIKSKSINGKTDHPITYTYLDSAKYAICYYRLKQIELDGSYYFGSVITLRTSATFNNFILYPNPATKNITIIFNNKINGFVKMYDINGNLKIIKQVSEEESNKEINISNLSNGIYFFELIDEKKGNMCTKYFIKK